MTDQERDELRQEVEARCRRFARKRGLDEEEVIAEGFLQMEVARTKHEAEDGRRGPLKTYTTWFVHNRLIDQARTALKHSIKLPQRAMPKLFSRAEYPLDSLLRDLSQDACTVVQMTLDADLGTGGWRRPRYKRHLTEQLKGLGWSFPRIMETFSEIHTALEG